MIIGIQGVQGSGKSTLVANACQHNSRYACVSIDDFYLPKHTLDTLQHIPEYKYRGNPGTHDLDDILLTLDTFKQTRSCTVPVYDKTLHSGLGDRAGRRGIVDKDVLFLEGWCLGFVSLDVDTNVDRHVRAYEAMHSRLDGLVILQPPFLEIVYEWRRQAETRLSDVELRSFIDMYMPTYRTYLPQLYNRPPVVPAWLIPMTAERIPTLQIQGEGSLCDVVRHLISSTI